MADEALVQQERPQVGIAPEADAVHLVALALHECRRSVERGQRIDRRIAFAHPGAHSDTHLVCRRVEVPDDLEARRLRQPVNGGDVEEKVEREFAFEALDEAG